MFLLLLVWIKRCGTFKMRYGCWVEKSTNRPWAQWHGVVHIYSVDIDRQRDATMNYWFKIRWMAVWLYTVIGDALKYVYLVDKICISSFMDVLFLQLLLETEENPVPDIIRLSFSTSYRLCIISRRPWSTRGCGTRLAEACSSEWSLFICPLYLFAVGAEQQHALMQARICAWGTFFGWSAAWNN